MFSYDSHIHHQYCGHAPQMSTKVILDQARKTSLETIAVTDHIFSPASVERIMKIREETDELIRDQSFNVIIGAEVDVNPQSRSGELVTENFENIEYIIAAFHYVPEFEESNDQEKLIEMWHSQLKGAMQNTKINTLAHPGRMIASCVDLDANMEHILAVFKDAAPLAAENNINWELNELNGTRIPRAYWQSWSKIYQTAVEAGVKLIYGSDAHSPLDIGKHDFVDELLRFLPTEAISNTDILRKKL